MKSFSGLTEFAQKYNVKTAYSTAIGNAAGARFGFFDNDRKLFKVIPVSKPCEVSSLNGNIEKAQSPFPHLCTVG